MPIIPHVQFVGSSTSNPETVPTVVVTVTLDQATTVDVTVPFTVSGTAIPTTNYTITSSPLTIMAGSLTATITITQVAGSLTAPSATIALLLGTPTNATLGFQTAYIATITNPLAIPVYPVLTPNQIMDIGLTQPATFFFSAVLQSNGTYTVQKGQVQDGKLIAVSQVNSLTKANAKTNIATQTAAYIDTL